MYADSRAVFNSQLTGSYYQGLTTKYNNVHFYFSTEVWSTVDNPPSGGAHVWMHADNWNNGWYQFPGTYFNGNTYYQCDGYNLNSQWVSSSGYQVYVATKDFWGNPTSYFSVGATALIQASA